MDSRIVRLVLMVGIPLVAAPAMAAKGKMECPSEVRSSIEREYDGAKIQSCEKEKELGQTGYSVKFRDRSGKNVEAQVSSGGEVRETEEGMPYASLPAAVREGFARKYGRIKAAHAEKVVQKDGTVTYDVIFGTAKARKEASFKSDGTFVEEKSGE